MWSARSLWILHAVGLALYLDYALAAHARGLAAWKLIVPVPLLYIGLTAVLTAAYFALSWVWRSPRPPEVMIGVGAAARMVLDEYLALLGAAGRMMFYGRVARDSRPTKSGPLPVLLVHGVLCNAGVWGRLLRYLRARGVGRLHVISYGPPLRDIELFADQLAGKIDAILASTNAGRVIVVSHSMGGLVARAYLRRYGAGKVQRVIMLGSPNHGSNHAWLFPGTCLAQMRPGNAWLEELNASPTPPDPTIVSIWSWHDSMVTPQTSSRLSGAQDIALSAIGHNALLGDRKVFALVWEQIRQARSETPGSTCTSSSGAFGNAP